MAGRGAKRLGHVTEGDAGVIRRTPPRAHTARAHVVPHTRGNPRRLTRFPAKEAARPHTPQGSVLRRPHLMRITNAGSSRAAAAGPFRPIWIDLTSGILRVSASLPCALGSICLSGSHWTITLPSPLAAIAESLCASLAFLSISKKRSLSRSRASTRDWFLSLSTVHPQRYAIHTALGLIHVMRESDHAPARCGARKEFAATAASAIAGL
mmetsp:Transcript_15239/g.38250  ORF Transcript_15239/g.38250 Transcript_15239/m.38250 type:complete len:210 (-) Transcript_15239:184-813(-)